MTTSCIIGTQTDQEALRNITRKEQHSVEIQCNLLGAPPLELLKPGVSLDDSFATETEPEEVDLDTSFHCSQEESTTECTTE